MSSSILDKSAGADRTGSAGIPVSRLTRVELRKLVDTRSGAWLLAAITATTLAAIVIYLFAADSQALTFEAFVNVTATPQGLLLPVLGIMAVTTEWTQRTALVTHALEPNRARVTFAKCVATLLLGILRVGLALGIAAVANMIGAGMLDGDGSWSYGAEGLRDTCCCRPSDSCRVLPSGCCS